jgi:aconitate decarboxylase
LSHKPFPTGRATHGGIDGLQRLIAKYDIAADHVSAGRFIVPPLTHRLVGRKPAADMSVAYARLCLSYCGAVCLRRGTVDLDDFSPAALADPGTLALASRLSVMADRNPDPNALTPLRVELDLAEGRTAGCDVAEVLGSPDRALSLEAALAKFAACGAPRVLWDTAMTLNAAGAANSLVSLL